MEICNVICKLLDSGTHHIQLRLFRSPEKCSSSALCWTLVFVVYNCFGDRKSEKKFIVHTYGEQVIHNPKQRTTSTNMQYYDMPFNSIVLQETNDERVTIEKKTQTRKKKKRKRRATTNTTTVSAPRPKRRRLAQPTLETQKSELVVVLERKLAKLGKKLCASESKRSNLEEQLRVADSRQCRLCGEPDFPQKCSCYVRFRCEHEDGKEIQCIKFMCKEHSCPVCLVEFDSESIRLKKECLLHYCKTCDDHHFKDTDCKYYCHKCNRMLCEDMACPHVCLKYHRIVEEGCVSIENCKHTRPAVRY